MSCNNFASSQNGCLYLQDLVLLVFRLFVGHEFIAAGFMKLQDANHAPAWFSGLDFPFPNNIFSADFNWFAAGWGECIFGVMLVLGFGSRIAAFALIYITWVAIYAVHFDLGWAGWNQIETDAGQGFKVPLMLALMLLAVLAQGSGKLGLDAWLASFWAQMAGRGSGLKDK